MFVDWRGVAIVLAVLAAVCVLCAIDLSCSGSRDPDVLQRVKSEMKSGRQEMSVLRREQLAEQLRDLRVLNKRLVQLGEKERSREVTLLILDLERQYQRARSRAEGR